MAKTLKKKHQDRVWLDGEGDIWFWDFPNERWSVLTFMPLGGEVLDSDDPYCPPITPDPRFGPYTKLFELPEC